MIDNILMIPRSDTTSDTRAEDEGVVVVNAGSLGTGLMVLLYLLGAPACIGVPGYC